MKFAIDNECHRGSDDFVPLARYLTMIAYPVNEYLFGHLYKASATCMKAARSVFTCTQTEKKYKPRTLMFRSFTTGTTFQGILA